MSNVHFYTRKTKGKNYYSFGISISDNNLVDSNSLDKWIKIRKKKEKPQKKIRNVSIN